MTDQPAIGAEAVRTSETHPIQVDFLPADIVPFPGRIGMTIAPGKRLIGMAAVWERDLEQDLQRLRQHYHTDVLVSLVQEIELETLNTPNLLSQIASHHMRSIWFPVPDFGTPASMSGLMQLVEQILELAQAGQTVVIHCRAGLGRTGLVTSACLVALGFSATHAFMRVREARPGCVETVAQEAYVQQFEREWRNRS